MGAKTAYSTATSAGDPATASLLSVSSPEPSPAPSPAHAKSLYGDYGATNGLLHDVRSAHAARDAVKSRALHELKVQLRDVSSGAPLTHAAETHLAGGDHIKSAVYGGLDGIITTFATVTSVAGSGLPHSVILIVGLAHLVADGLSMGLGDMLSSQAEADLIKHERAREEWEFDNFPEGEMDEMIELYERKGIATADATLIVRTMAKYKDAFIDSMMVEELNLMPAGDDDSPLKGGVITFVSFMAFGVIPLISYLANLLPGVSFSADATFNASCVLTVVTLFLLGAVKGSFVGQQWYMSGASMAVNGSIAAFFGWLIGFLLQLSGIQDVA